MLTIVTTEPCQCWLEVNLHSGHCCFRDDPTPVEELRFGQMLACGHVGQRQEGN